MKTLEQATGEFAEKWGYLPDVYKYEPEEAGVTITMGTWHKDKEGCISDLNALIKEYFVPKEEAGYPLEFVEWLIKDQEIFFGELNEEYILNDNLHIGGRKLKTIDELYEYWKENEQ